MKAKTKQQFVSTELDLSAHKQAITGRLSGLGKERFDRVLSLIRGNETVTELAILSLLAEKKIALVITGNARRQAKWLAMPEQIAELPNILAVVGAQPNDVKLSSFEQQRQIEQEKLQAMEQAQQERLEQYSAKRQAEFEQLEAQALDTIRRTWSQIERDSYDRLKHELSKRAESERVITQLRNKRELQIQKRDLFRNEYRRLLNRDCPNWLLDDIAPMPEGLSDAIKELQK